MLGCTAGSSDLLKKATGLHLVCRAGALFTPQMTVCVHFGKLEPWYDLYYDLRAGLVYSGEAVGLPV